MFANNSVFGFEEAVNERGSDPDQWGTCCRGRTYFKDAFLNFQDWRSLAPLWKVLFDDNIVATAL